MTAIRLDITLEQGADYDGSFSLDFDPTGYGAAMQIKLATGYPYAILTLTTFDGGLVIDGPNKDVIPIIPGSVSAAINPGRYAYDLKLIAPTGRAIRVYEGEAYVSADVTDTPVFAPSTFLLEGGGILLLENGSPLLLENGNGPNGVVTLLLENGMPLLLENGLPFLLDDGDSKPPGPAFLLENGSYLLAESGNFLLMEA
jgi:hypothetical protein